MQIETGYSYDDVLLKPKNSRIRTRSNVDLTTSVVPGLEINRCFISAPMDTVTESEMATGMQQSGSLGIIHRYLDPENQAKEVNKTDGKVAATIGIGDNWERRLELLLDAGVDFVCVDVAHGHMDRCLDVITETSEITSKPVMAGNIATKSGAKDMIKAGADSVKVGIGPGSHCQTREVAGVGVPQATAVITVVEALSELTTVSDDEYTIIADGGIQNSGDAAKAIGLGADAVMMGGIFAGCEESPTEVVEINGKKYKRSRGMASDEARNKNDMETDEAKEGAAGLTLYSGPVRNVIEDLAAGVRSGLSYINAENIEEAHNNAEFIRVTPSTINRNGTHGVYTDSE